MKFLFLMCLIPSLGCAIDKSEYKNMTFYLSHTLFIENRDINNSYIHSNNEYKVSSTNYKKDKTVLPINTKVKIKKIFLILFSFLILLDIYFLVPFFHVLPCIQV